MAKAKISELNEFYTDAESCDKDLFAEQRSNLLLISGDHYAKLANKIWANVRARSDISPEQKIRLTKNHIQKIHKTYVNSLISSAPGCVIVADNDKELRDKKSAQLRESVWQHAKRKYRIKEKVRSWADDFYGIGEVFVKVFWDPTMGDLVGYEQELNDNGEPQFSEDGSPAKSQRGVFSGDFVFDSFHGFNVLRSPKAKSFEESHCIVLRKMADTKDLKAQWGNDPEKLRFIEEDLDKTFVVFEGQKGTYSKVKGQTMVREYYYRPSPTYPKGYYYITTENGILDEGELPFGIWPIAMAQCERIQTSPRGRSPIKHARPYQAEINRSASKIAEHQITLGDDKIVLRNGSTLSQGALFPGVRGYTATGEAPVIIPGRDGSQYLSYMQSQIAELYDVMGVQEIQADKNGNLDAYTLLFKSASQKKMFSAQIERFEQFLIDICMIFMELAPKYYPPTLLIPMIGSQEAVNLAEIENGEKIGFQIKIEPLSEDIETLLGKQLMMTQALQYASTQLGPTGIAQILKSMPFGSVEGNLVDLTLDQDSADNMILALDRGEMPDPNEYDPHPYMIKRLTARKRQADFKTLNPMVQQNYSTMVSMHEQMEAMVQAKLMAAKSEYIPTGGALVVCDLYVKDPKNPLSSKRVRVPYESLNWLIQQIEMQGTSLEQLNNIGPQAQGDVGARAAQMVHPQGAAQRPQSGDLTQPQAGGNLPLMPGQ